MFTSITSVRKPKYVRTWYANETSLLLALLKSCNRVPNKELEQEIWEELLLRL